MLLMLLTALASAPTTVEPVSAEVPTAAPGKRSTGPKPWLVDPYWRPHGNARGISVGGRTSLQVQGGAEVGLDYVHAPVVDGRRGSPDIRGRSRFRGGILYGFLSQSVGADLRLGSFMGPTSRFVTYQVGPDVWFNGYGNPDSTDYFLPWSLGLDLRNVVVFHPDPRVSFQLGAIPGWAFNKRRRIGNVGPFHEITGFAAVDVRLQGFAFTLGYQRIYNSAGTTDGLIFSAGF